MNMAITNKLKKIQIKKINVGFMKRSDDSFPVDDIEPLLKYEQSIIDLLENKQHKDMPNKSKLMTEIPLIHKYKTNVRYKIAQQEPDYENITGNSFNKLFAGA